LGPIPNPQSPIPNPQSPIPNPISCKRIHFIIIINFINYIFKKWILLHEIFSIQTFIYLCAFVILPLSVLFERKTVHYKLLCKKIHLIFTCRFRIRNLQHWLFIFNNTSENQKLIYMSIFEFGLFYGTGDYRFKKLAVKFYTLINCIITSMIFIINCVIEFSLTFIFNNASESLIYIYVYENV
jgi:hypothetical protein